jgi:2-keto-4-pentenoate hydratase/2-oxohepta-3-ene-1,7-dioic acid hydratase in catechol pathway
MRLMRVGPIGAERPVVTVDGRLFHDVGTVADDINPAFFAGNGVERVRQAMASNSLAETSIEGERIAAPIDRPGSIVCVGQNYAKHAAESGATSLPTEPIIFFKSPNTLVGPHDDLVLPPAVERVDWEVELGVVMGRRVQYLASPEQALENVAGFVLCNDVSERQFQLDLSGGQWSKGKCFDTFNPLGPWLLTADEVENAQQLSLRTWVNGDLRQDSSTSDMIFSVSQIVWSLSQFMVLEPGDLINTGTPEGVALSGRFPYLKDGDHLRMTIDQLGTLDQHARAFA